jgi:hypothetical protein
MTFALHPHPETSSTAIGSLTAEATRPAPDLLQLTYILAGDTDRIRLPEPAPPERTDGLWQHTCFEAFVRGEEGEAYLEFNLSPSRRWAAYHFDYYRAGMANAELGTPETALLLGDGKLVLTATIAGLPSERPWHVGLSAVIEEKDGHRSYWALRHPDGKPDFHHRDCFALELRPPA